MVIGLLSCLTFVMRIKKEADFHLSGATAKVRLTTNQSRVLATPNSACVDLTRSGVINDESPNAKRMGTDFWYFFKAHEPKEFITRDLGVKGLSLKQLEQHGHRLYHNAGKSTYVSKDIEVDAEQPLTIFTPYMLREALEKNGNSACTSRYEFGVTFTPKAGHQYQLVLEPFDAKLLDITEGIPVDSNNMLQKPGSKAIPDPEERPACPATRILQEEL